MVALTSLARGSALSEEELFRIERSTNRNVVEFDLRLLADRRVDRERPVQAYWRLLAEDGRREELTWLEKQFAYGFTVESEQEGFALKLIALARRVVRIRQRGARWHATLAIGGRPAILRRVWVESESTILGPRVRWVDLYGTDERTGERLVERIANR
jgi:hypothetical protein